MSWSTCREHVLPAALTLTFAAAPAPLSGQQAVVRGDLGRRLDSALTASERAGFSGAVLVERGGSEVLYRGAGAAIEDPRTPFAPSTIVPIGSNTKDFTKAAILGLVEAGRLRLEDSLGRFFPDAPEDKHAITVRQLLDHTAGFPIGVGPDDERVTLTTWRQRLFATPLEFAPGTSRRYSNAGYSLLAAIIEQVSGVAYERFLVQRVFAPAGMRETGLVLPIFDRQRLAHAYSAGLDRGTMLDMPRDSDGSYWNLRGNGGLVSTLEDMRRFYRAILNDTAILRSAAHRAMVVPPDGPTVLAGSDLVSFFMYARFPRESLEIFIASNHGRAPAPHLLDELLPIMGIQPPGREGPHHAEGPTIPAGQAHPAFPETGPGRTVAEYFAAYNTGDTTAVRRFFTEHADSGPDAPSMAARLDRYRQMFENLGRMTAENVITTPDGIEVRARAANGDLVTLTFIIKAAAPFRLGSLRVRVG